MKAFIVDAFTSQPFGGNPAAFCLCDVVLEPARMLAIAQEFNLSETAFVTRTPANAFAIRYFSPIMEIPLCGHATLASALVLHRESGIEAMTFTTVNGLELAVSVVEEGVTMTLPEYTTTPAAASPDLIRALGVESCVNVELCPELKILLVEISSSAHLAALTPNFADLVRSQTGISGVCVTARSESSEFDFESRYFWPWSGSNEDPVTGGTHTFLTPYWASRMGKTTLHARQCSARGGTMTVELVGGKVRITGHGVIVLEGNLLA
jgi:PhzF family phenazine biosynthesis protein